METLIARWSYWLGIACLVITVIWWAVNVFRSWWSSAILAGHGIAHVTFLHASIAFLVTTIATTCYAWLNTQKP